LKIAVLLVMGIEGIKKFYTGIIRFRIGFRLQLFMKLCAARTMGEETAWIPSILRKNRRMDGWMDSFVRSFIRHEERKNERTNEPVSIDRAQNSRRTSPNGPGRMDHKVTQGRTKSQVVGSTAHSTVQYSTTFCESNFWLSTSWSEAGRVELSRSPPSTHTLLSSMGIPSVCFVSMGHSE